jgi:signal transduction histidine kinase
VSETVTQPFAPIDVRDEVLLSVLLQGLPHAVRIYDPEFRCLMANDLGRTSPLLRAFGGNGSAGFLPETDLQWEHWPVTRAMRSGRPALQNYVVEDGEGNAIFLDVLALPVPGTEARPRLVVELTRDVTESTVQTAKLRRLEVLLAEMVDQLSDVVASSQTLGDLPRRFVISGAVGACPHMVSCPLFAPMEDQAAETAGTHSLEICSHCQIAQMTYPDQLQRLTTSLDGLLETLHQKHQQLLETQREVIHAERLAAVGELVAGIAHEINNPIGIILSRLDALELEAESRPLSTGLTKDLAVIRSHSQRITRTVESLLTFCRKWPRRLAVGFDINRVLHEALEFVGSILARRSVEVDAQVGGRPLPVQGDPSALQQVFINLFINAADAMASGGRLTVRSGLSAETADCVEVTVADTGHGIPPELVNRVFDPFFTTKQSRGGTGLGLSVSRRIIEEFHGKIAVESVVGQGTTFRITLPMQREEVTAAP